MAEHSSARPLTMRVLYAAICVMILFVQLLPLETAQPSSLTPPPLLSQLWAAPDLVLALTFAWAVRRPEYVPPLLVGAVGLLADLLLQRPPGLRAALMVLGTQALRGRAHGLRDRSFLPEWVAVAGTLIAMLVAERVILSLLMADRAPLGLTVMQALSTLAAYPAVVFASFALLRLRKRSPSDFDPAGRRA